MSVSMKCSTFVMDHNVDFQLQNTNEEVMISFLEYFVESSCKQPQTLSPELSSQALLFLDSKLGKYTMRSKSSVFPKLSDQTVLKDSADICKNHQGNLKKLLRMNILSIDTQDNEAASLTGRCLAVYGAAYENGYFGLKICRKIALTFYKRSAELKNPMGTYSLARCFEFGIGCDIDLERACYFYRVSYKLGYRKGLHRYALILIKGNSFVQQDIPTGYHLLKLAVSKADSLYTQPFYDLGMFYKSLDSNVLTDHKYAFQVFLQGAKAGCRNCQYKVAEEYEKGAHIKMDLDRSFQWYKISADNGQSNAQMKIASILFNDNLCCDDRCERNKICINHYSGRYCLNTITKHFDSSFDRFLDGFQYAMKAAVSLDVNGLIMVANAYENGYGVQRNLLQSLWWHLIIKVTFPSSVDSKKIAILEKMLGIPPIEETKSHGIIGYFIDLIKNI